MDKLDGLPAVRGTVFPKRPMTIRPEIAKRSHIMEVLKTVKSRKQEEAKHDGTLSKTYCTFPNKQLHTEGLEYTLCYRNCTIAVS